MIRCSTASAIGKMQIKSTRYYFVPTRMARIKTRVVEYVEKLESLNVVGGNVTLCHYIKQFGGSSKS